MTTAMPVRYQAPDNRWAPAARLAGRPPDIVTETQAGNRARWLQAYTSPFILDDMLRFLLFRVLPRRLFPILVIIEIIQFIRHRRRRDVTAAAPTQTQ